MLGTNPGPVTRVVQRLAIATTRGRLAPVGVAAYRFAARSAAAFLARGADASVYARSGSSSSEVVPGISDIDLALVVADGPAGPDVAVARIRRRWHSLARWAPPLGRLVELPMVYDVTDLAELTGPSYATWGLDLYPRSRPAFAPSASLLDWRRRLERPGLYDDLDDWRRIRGRDLLPPPVTRARSEELVAAWLELSFWWWFALEGASAPRRPFVGLLCKKLVAEPERVRLWLEHRERPAGRTEILEGLAAGDGPESEAAATMLALDTRSSAAAPIDLALASLTRQTASVAALIGAEAVSSGTTPVRLVGSRALVPGHGLDGLVPGPSREHAAGALPLCDWQALAATAAADESFGATDETASVESVARVAGTELATTPVFRSAGLLVFPRLMPRRPMPRRIACAAFDPVSFALLGGRDEAEFPEVRGLSVADVATRAVLEQRRRAVGASTPVSPVVRTLELAVAARAALLHETVAAGSPELALTVLGALEQLADRVPGARDACEELGGALAAGAEPSPAAVVELESVVGSLPAYAG